MEVMGLKTNIQRDLGLGVYTDRERERDQGLEVREIELDIVVGGLEREISRLIFVDCYT